MSQYKTTRECTTVVDDNIGDYTKPQLFFRLAIARRFKSSNRRINACWRLAAHICPRANDAFYFRSRNRTLS